MIMPARAFVFDAYGTLFDVHAAIARYRDACGPDADRVSDLWRIKQLEYTWTLTLAGRYEDFWILTQRALDYAMARYPSVPPNLKPALLDAYFSLDAFPDAVPCLTALRQSGQRTAILSNGSPSMLAAAVDNAGMGTVLDAVFSVDAIRLYKPRREVYALATEGLSAQPADIVFVSSNRWDVMGAAEFGFAAVWINRRGMPDEYEDCAPMRVLANLSALQDV
jgi:2-haloacid dehalogenase